ncbi:hypothetical protein, partial [Klebsiella quasipneumoniae]
MASKPPGQQDSTAKDNVEADREKQNKRLTLNEENVLYGTSRQSAKARRNCSLTIYQTICVGTQ